MANIIGIDYYRIVSETSGGEWSQVFVKTAFDQDELAQIGSVFGVVKLTSGEDLVEKGMKLIAKLDKFCSDAKNKGGLAGLLSLLKEEKADGAFVWVLAERGGKRRIKVGALPGNSIAVLRGGKRVWLSEQPGKVVVGEVKEGDLIYFGMKEAVDLIDAEIGEMKEDLETLSEKMTGEMMNRFSGARAALVLKVRDMPSEAGVEEEVLMIPKDKTYQREVTERIAKRQEEEGLASDRVVGATGLTGKIASAKLSWKDFTTKWAAAPRLPADGGWKKRKRLFLLLGLVFILILGTSVFMGYLKLNKDALANRYNTVFEPLEKKRQEAENLYSLNPVGARDLLRSVRGEVAAKKGEFGKTEFVDEIASFEKRVEESWSKVSGEQRASLTLFFDLGLVRSGMKGDRMSFNGKELLVLDQNVGMVAKVSYPDKRQEVILGKGEGQNWLDVTGLGANNTMLYKSGLIGILSGMRSELTFDAAVTSPVAIDAFTGAVYVLDKGAREIWRFAESGGNIGERRRWLAAEVEADLTGGVDLAIDTDIWVGTENGKILRFRRGQSERFSISDVPAEFKIKRLAISRDVPMVAVLDSEKGRVVLFNKETGVFLKQLLTSEFSEATDLVFVSGKELMVVVGNKLFLVPI